MTHAKKTISIPPHLLAQAQQYAADAEVSLSAYVTKAVDHAVQQENARRYQKLTAANREWAAQLDADCAAQDAADPWFAATVTDPAAAA